MTLEALDFFEPDRHRPLSSYPDPWNLSDGVYDQVVQIIADDYDASIMNSDLVNGPDLVEVSQKVFWEALSKVDDRSWHDRCVDVLTQRYLPRLEDSEYDFLLREFDYKFNKENTDYSRKKYEGHSHQSLEGHTKGDIDFLRGRIDDDRVKLEVWEAKSHPDYLEETDQLERIENTAMQVAENTGLAIDVEPKKIHSGEIQDHLIDRGLPDKYSGTVYVPEDASDDLLESENFWNIVRFFFYNPVYLEEEIEVEERVDDWI